MESRYSVEVLRGLIFIIEIKSLYYEKIHS